MSCYFIVDVYIDENKGRGSYEDYIERVKPIVESFGGEYLVRTEKIRALSPLRNPGRVIVIRFPSREELMPVLLRMNIGRSCMNERIMWMPGQ